MAIPDPTGSSNGIAPEVAKGLVKTYGRFYAKTQKITALKMEFPCSVGGFTGEAGDYLILAEDGSISIKKAADFHGEYKLTRASRSKKAKE